MLSTTSVLRWGRLLATPLVLCCMFLLEGDLIRARSLDSTESLVGTPLHISEEIETSLKAEGWADVLIWLDDGISHSAPLDEQVRAAAAAQTKFLEDFGPAGFSITKSYEHFPMLAGRATRAGTERLRSHPMVLHIDPDITVYPQAPAISPQALPNPAGLTLVEARDSIGVDQVHREYGLRGKGIGVAVLDTGIDSDHPDFEGAVVDQICYSSNSRSCAPSNLPKSDNAEDEQGHGTSVSGIVLGRGAVAPRGVAPEAHLLAVRVFRDRGGAPTNDIVDGLDWVLKRQVEHNVRVVNMSLGGGAQIGNNCDRNFGGVKNVFQRLIAKSVSIIVATGNGGNPDRVSFPGCISNATGIGATWDAELNVGAMNECHGRPSTTPNDITCYTDRGRSMDIVAPGSIIVTSRIGGGTNGSGPTRGGHGTSFASPMVAGAAALMYEADPDLRPADVQRIIEQTGDTVIHPETEDEIPRLNVLAAIQSIVPATPTPVPTSTPEDTPTPLPSATPTPVTPTDTPEVSDTETPMPTDTPDEAGEIEVFLPIAFNNHAPQAE